MSMSGIPLVILILRLLLSPVLIACATLVDRRWGPEVSGWFTGFPFVSAPISILLAISNSPTFAADAAVATLGGQACICLFALAYYFAAKKLKWFYCIPIGLAAFLLFAYFWKSLAPGVIISLAVLLIVTFLSLYLLRGGGDKRTSKVAPRWDLPVRMLTACVVVYAVTGISSVVGARWSGLFSSIPAFGLILASFTHAQSGPTAVKNLLRGYVMSSFGIAVFYLILSVFLPSGNLVLIYTLAALALVGVNFLALRVSRRFQGTPT